MEYFTYILKSLKDDRYYYGSCKDVEARLKKHNSGAVPSTKFRRPMKVHYFEAHSSKSEAYKRELFFKSIDGYNWLRKNKIIKHK